MFKKSLQLLFISVLILMLSACNTSSSKQENSVREDPASQEEQSKVTETSDPDESLNTESFSGKVSNTLAQDEEALKAECVSRFDQLVYDDEQTGSSITYNLYLPEGYGASSSYPMVVFIADSSCTGNDASRSLKQGRGALVWACEEWQSVYPTIVAVPTYPVTILDDHGSYTETEYVELTKRFVDYMKENYAVDKERVYGTGQSMGCMTSLILAAKYPDLYAACMFVDGQWDITALAELEDQTFVYFAAEDDSNAFNGAKEVMEMFDRDGVSYKYERWDGNWSADELSAAALQLFTSDEDRYFISWKTGTIDASSSNMPGSAAYHMASFDYAYNCVAVMEWLIAQ